VSERKMQSNIRVSGAKIVGNIPWGTHFCQFYQTKEDLMDILIPYLKAGLENNEFCVWITPQFLEVEEAKKALRKAVPDLDIYLEKGQIKIIFHTDWYITEDAFDSQKAIGSLAEKVNQFLVSGYDGLRFVENICRLEKESRKDFVNYEKRVDSITGRYPVISLCAYSLDTCSATDIIDIAANHQFILSKENGEWEKTENSGGKCIDVCKQAEEALQKSEERYCMLFTHMTDGFGLVEVIYNDDGKPHDYRYLEINPAFGEYLGAKREQMLGRTMLEVFPDVNPIALEKYHEVAVSLHPVHFEIFSYVADKYLDIYAFSPEKGKLALILRNITERKHLEEKTRQRAEEMETIMEVVPVSILIGHDPQGNNITGNRMANELYNADAGENISADITQSVRFFYKGRELTASELPIQQAALKDADVRDVEIDVLLPGGKWRTILASASPLHDVNGLVRGSVGSFIDITERKEAETRLKETLDNLEKLVKERTAELEKAYNSLKESSRGLAEAQKMAHIGNWEWDIVSEKSYWSDELYRIFGRNLQELHPTYEEFLNYVHPEDREYVYNNANKAMKGKPYSIDYRIVRVDGEVRTVHMQSEVIFDDKRTPVRIKGTVQDITERRQMENALRQNEALLSAFLDQLPVGIGLVNPQGHLLVANKIFSRFVSSIIPSRDPENSWRWQTWGADGRLLKQTEWPGARALQGENVTPGLDFLYTSDDGQEIWTRVSSVPFRDGAGDIKGVIAVIQDVDEQKRSEEALAKMEKIRIKEIHHRIKNNLQVISSLLDLQAETFSKLEVCKTPEVVEAFMESQSRVISMSLIHEELYKGDKLEALDFSAYLRKLTAELFTSYNLENKDISFKLDLDKVYLGMDTAIPLGIIVNELVSNSFKHAFSAKQEGEIHINLRKAETPASKINTSSFKNDGLGPDRECIGKLGFQYVLEVSDSGKGIQEEIDIKNSSSLGLQLVNILVEQIEGCIELENDKGTKFTIWFSDIEI
jgi:PAS domain S-box-containing protein